MIVGNYSSILSPIELFVSVSPKVKNSGNPNEKVTPGGERRRDL